MIASKAGATQQHSQDYTNLLETSMDSPTSSPVGQAGITKIREKTRDSRSRERKDYRISQQTDTADWNSLSGWQGGPIPKSQNVNIVTTPSSSSAVKSKPQLTIEKAVSNIEDSNPQGTGVEHSIKYIPQVRKKQQQERKDSATRGHRTARERPVVLSQPYTTDKRNIEVLPDPNVMNLADFVRTSLGFLPIETTRFQTRAKSNLTRIQRRSIVSDYPVKLGSPRLDKSVFMNEATTMQMPMVYGVHNLGIPRSYFDLDPELSVKHKNRQLGNFQGDNKNEHSYLDQKNILSDTKKILSNLSRIRVMKILNNTTKLVNVQIPSNIDTKEPEKPRFSLDVRQKSASRRSKISPQSHQDIRNSSQSKLRLSTTLKGNTRKQRQASPSSNSQSREVKLSGQRARTQPKLASYLQERSRRTPILGGEGIEESTNQSTQNGTRKPGVKEGSVKAGQIAEGLFSVCAEHMELSLKQHLALVHARRQGEGTTVRSILVKSQPPNLTADPDRRRELSTKRRQALENWKQNFERSKEGLYQQNSAREDGRPETEKIHGKAELICRSDIEGLIWQLDSLGKKMSKKIAREVKQGDCYQMQNSTRVALSLPKESLDKVALERKRFTPFQQGLGVERQRHIRSVSMGFMSAPRSEPVVNIKNSSGRLLVRYQLKKAYVQH